MNTMSSLLLGLLILAVAVAGDDNLKTCPGAPWMTVESACRNVSGTQAMYDTCKDALREIPNPLSDHDATVYALAAASSALASAAATEDAAIRLVHGGSEKVSGEEKDAYEECIEAYTTAGHAMVAVIDKLGACGFGDLAGGYLDVIVDIESCRDRVLKLTASPIYGMVLVDRNKAGLAFIITKKLLGV
uniref:Pectinesterase inhibitor domain-containing protein n=1 Tax=Leersia perrieri TaxID=77586 RepID=A0A0D9X4A5_9ORYZ